MTEEDIKAAETWYRQNAGARRTARQTPEHLRARAARARAKALDLEALAVGMRAKADRLDRRAALGDRA